MPLRCSGEKPAYGFLTSSVSFYMVDDNGTRVRCSISDRALNQFVPNVERTEQGLLKAFRAYREAIGALAVGKYDRGQFADDGKTVKICEADVPPQDRGGKTA